MKDLEKIKSCKHLQNKLSYFNQENSPSHGFENISIIIVNKNNKNKKKHNVFMLAQQPRMASCLSKSSKSKKHSSIIRHSSMPELNKCTRPVTADALRNKNAWENDTKLNKYNKSPFKSKFIKNIVSEHRFAKNFNPFNYPGHTKLKIYRCLLGLAQDNCCCSCNSDAIFKVMKGLYDCYKAKNCDKCDCIFCGRLRPDQKKEKSITALSEKTRLERAKAEGLLTPLTGKTPEQKVNILEGLAKKGLPLPEGKTLSENILIYKACADLGLLKEPKTKAERVKHDETARAGLLQPLEGMTPEQTEKIFKGLQCLGIPLPEGRTPSEKSLIAKVAARSRHPSKPSTMSMSPSKQLCRAKADGLLTPLTGKTPEQKVKISEGLAKKGLPLPDGKTLSEKELIYMADADLGLLKEPKKKAERAKHDQAARAVLLQPLEGMTPEQAEEILKGLHDLGIPLPEGRTASEKTLLAKVAATSRHPSKCVNTQYVVPKKQLKTVAAGIDEELEEMVQITKCDRACGCSKKKIRFKHSYVKIRVMSPDISSFCDCPGECFPGGKSGAFIDNDGIKVTVGRVIVLQNNNSVKGSNSVESCCSRPCSTERENMYLQSRTCEDRTSKSDRIVKCLRRLQSFDDIYRGETSETKTVESSLDSVLVINSMTSLCSTNANKSLHIISSMSIMESSTSSSSTRYSDNQSIDEPLILQDGPITSEDYIGQSENVSEMGTLRSIETVIPERENTISRIHPTKFNLGHYNMKKNKSNSKSEEPVVLIKRWQSELDVSKIMSKIMTNKQFAGASSIFIIVPVSDDDEEECFSDKLDSMTSIYPSETSMIHEDSSRVNPNEALSRHHLPDLRTPCPVPQSSDSPTLGVFTSKLAGCSSLHEKGTQASTSLDLPQTDLLPREVQDCSLLPVVLKTSTQSSDRLCGIGPVRVPSLNPGPQPDRCRNKDTLSKTDIKGAGMVTDEMSGRQQCLQVNRQLKMPKDSASKEDFESLCRCLVINETKNQPSHCQASQTFNQEASTSFLFKKKCECKEKPKDSWNHFMETVGSGQSIDTDTVSNRKEKITKLFSTVKKVISHKSDESSKIKGKILKCETDGTPKIKGKILKCETDGTPKIKGKKPDEYSKIKEKKSKCNCLGKKCKCKFSEETPTCKCSEECKKFSKEKVTCKCSEDKMTCKCSDEKVTCKCLEECTKISEEKVTCKCSEGCKKISKEKVTCKCLEEKCMCKVSEEKVTCKCSEGCKKFSKEKVTCKCLEEKCMCKVSEEKVTCKCSEGCTKLSEGKVTCKCFEEKCKCKVSEEKVTCKCSEGCTKLSEGKVTCKCLEGECICKVPEEKVTYKCLQAKCMPKFSGEKVTTKWLEEKVATEKLVTLTSELAECASVFKACQKKKKQQRLGELAAEIKSHFEAAVKYYVIKNPERFRDLIQPLDSDQDNKYQGKKCEAKFEKEYETKAIESSNERDKNNGNDSL